MDSYQNRLRAYGNSSQASMIGASSSTHRPTPSTAVQTSESEALGGGHHDAVKPVTEPSYSAHTYNLNQYAFVAINCLAGSTQSLPLVYLGEKITGSVVFPEHRLREVRSIVIALRVFISDPKNPSYKTKVVLLPEQIDESYISNHQFSGRFAIAPPPATDSPPSPRTASEQANSTVGGLPSPINLKFQLQITIHRHGWLTRKIRLKQPIRCIRRPDPSTLLPAPPTLLQNPRATPVSWIENRCPPVIVRGTIFHKTSVEVECKLILPTSYPVSEEIPLSLVMTCDNRVAIDLFALSHVIDVRLLKVLAFGKNAAAATPPFTLADRGSYHMKEWVARALWDADGRARELPLTDAHRHPHWRIKLNGRLLRDPKAEIDHSFEEPGMAQMYYVCLFPFCSTNFSPMNKPDKALFYGKIKITKPRTSQ